MLARFPGLAKRVHQNSSNFLFQHMITRQAESFRALEEALDMLSPPLDLPKARAHYDDMLAGTIRPADQIAAFLPPALFLMALHQRIRPTPAISRARDKPHGCEA
jgi:hypothetical protein